MSEETSGLAGVDRAAVLLLSIGEKNAAQVLRLMEPKEIQRLGGAMANLRKVSAQQIDTVVRSFLENVGQHTALGVDSQDYIRNTLVEALGRDRGGALVSRILTGSDPEGLEALKWMEPRSIVDLIRDEHPQLTAIVLAYLDSDQAAGVVALLPAERRADVLTRVATMDELQPEALEEINRTLESKAAESGSSHTTPAGGIKAAAAILNLLDGEVEAELLDRIRADDGDLAQRMSDLMFVFEDLLQLDDPGTQLLLREVESDKLLIALKGADESLKEKFFRNMSKRAAEILREDLEATGPVRLSEVEEAQREIITAAHQLSEDGQIALGGRGGDVFV